VINNSYSGLGVTFNNPLGPADIYARSTTLAASLNNVVSVFQTGVPAFDARFGAVEAVFSTPQLFVSIDAAILRVPEGLTNPTNFPKLEIYNTGGFVTSVDWNFIANPQPPPVTLLVTKPSHTQLRVTISREYGFYQANRMGLLLTSDFSIT